MIKYRKKPVVIEATQWLGNFESIKTMFPVNNAVKPTTLDYINEELVIHTLEGDMKASKGDWIIKGIHGELYPCKPDIFEKTYEIVENNE